MSCHNACQIVSNMVLQTLHSAMYLFHFRARKSTLPYMYHDVIFTHFTSQDEHYFGSHQGARILIPLLFHVLRARILRAREHSHFYLPLLTHPTLFHDVTDVLRSAWRRVFLAPFPRQLSYRTSLLPIPFPISFSNSYFTQFLLHLIYLVPTFGLAASCSLFLHVTRSKLLPPPLRSKLLHLTFRVPSLRSKLLLPISRPALTQHDASYSYPPSHTPPF